MPYDDDDDEKCMENLQKQQKISIRSHDYYKRICESTKSNQIKLMFLILKNHTAKNQNYFAVLINKNFNKQLK